MKTNPTAEENKIYYGQTHVYNTVRTESIAIFSKLPLDE